MRFIAAAGYEFFRGVTIPELWYFELSTFLLNMWQRSFYSVDKRMEQKGQVKKTLEVNSKTLRLDWEVLITLEFQLEEENSVMYVRDNVYLKEMQLK